MYTYVVVIVSSDTWRDKKKKMVKQKKKTSVKQSCNIYDVICVSMSVLVT